MCERDMKIEEEEIDHVSVKQTVGQVSHDAGEKQSQRDIAPAVPHVTPKKESHYESQGRAGKDNEEEVIVPKRPEGGAGIRNKNQREKLRHNDSRLFRRDVLKREPLRHLVERVEREGKEED